MKKLMHRVVAYIVSISMLSSISTFAAEPNKADETTYDGTVTTVGGWTTHEYMYLNDPHALDIRSTLFDPNDPWNS